MRLEDINPNPLSAPCMAVLKDRDAYIAQHVGNMVEIKTCEGDYLFWVTTDISRHDLDILFTVHERRWKDGVEAGREQAFAELRALIGAAAQPKEPT